jgi:hypothetical protein
MTDTKTEAKTPVSKEPTSTITPVVEKEPAHKFAGWTNNAKGFVWNCACGKSGGGSKTGEAGKAAFIKHRESETHEDDK